MRNIRKKLASGNAQLIKTKAGTGYMMDDVWNNASNV
jgi:DNA-binding response OmpR family regulator